MTVALRPAAVTIAEALAAAREHVDPSEARLLLRHALGVSAASLAAHPERTITSEALQRYREWVERRARGEPVAYILGEREFYGRRFAVGPQVLIPRPETELLADLAIDRLRRSEGAARVLDLGTGAGAIAITLALEVPAAEVWATDVCPQALALAERNATRLGATVRFVLSDWFDRLPDVDFDLIVSNPPYVAEADPHLDQGDVRFEPRGALVAGSDGLDAIRRIAAEAPRHLRAGGWLMLEHGWDQAAPVRRLLAESGFACVESRHDLAGIERTSLGRRS